MEVFLDTIAIFGADTPFDDARDETLARLNGVPSRTFSKMEVAQLIDNCNSIFAPGMRLRRVGLADLPVETLGVAENLLLRVDHEQCILCGANLSEESCVLANDELTGSGDKRLREAKEADGAEIFGQFGVRSHTRAQLYFKR